MALSLDPATRVISVPQSDLTLVSGTLYTMNTDNFRKDVMDLLASENYAWMPDAFIHNTAVTVAGTTFARTLEFINSYSITFTPDSNWSVRLEGSNNNIFDVQNGILNQNQVQVIPTNSAGLIGSKQLEDQSFDDARIWIDVDAGQAGQAYPIGTPGSPVNNLADAQAIISVRGLPKRLHLRGTLAIGATDVLDDYDVEGNGDLLSGMTFAAGSTVAAAHLGGLTVSGTVSGQAMYDDCALGTITGFEGRADRCTLGATITLAGDSEFNACASNVAGTGTPEIDANSLAGLSVQVRDYYGGMLFTNYNQAGNNASFDSSSIRLTLASSCTNGVIVVGGSGQLTNNSTSFVRDESFNNVSDEESIKIGEIHRRLDLVGNQVYADDGSFISNPVFTLTKVDNGDGTFTVSRDLGQSVSPVTSLWRGAVEPPQVGGAGNQVKAWRGAIEPSAG